MMAQPLVKVDGCVDTNEGRFAHCYRERSVAVETNIALIVNGIAEVHVACVGKPVDCIKQCEPFKLNHETNVLTEVKVVFICNAVIVVVRVGIVAPSVTIFIRPF